jgi:tetratricopeptide (TPR) repeat protein
MMRIMAAALLAARLVAQDDALLGKALSLEARGDLASAESTLFEYIGLQPHDARGYGRLAHVLLARGDYRRAGNFATTALSYKADYPEALIVQGQLYGMQGRIAQAEELLKRASELDPNSADAPFQLGTLFDREKRNAEAVAQFERVVKLRPDDPRGWDYLALNLELLGQLERSETGYRRGLAVNKAPLLDSFLDYNYGRFLMKQGRLEESKYHLDRAVRLAPQTRAVHFERGKVNLLLRHYAEARLDEEHALQLPDPSGVILDTQIYYALTTVYKRLGQEDLARKYAALTRSTK